MIIANKIQKIVFRDLAVGVCFDFRNELYIKTNGEYKNGNAVNLESGELEAFDDYAETIPLPMAKITR